MRLITNLLKHLLLLIIGMALLSALALLLGVKLLLDEQPALTQFDKASLEDIRRIKNIAIAVNRQINQRGINELILSERDLNLGISHFGPTTVAIPDQTFAKIQLSEQSNNIQLTVPANYASTEVYTQIKNQLNDKELLAVNMLRSLAKDKWINASWEINIDNAATAGQWITPGQLSIGSFTLSQSLSTRLARQILAEATSTPNAKPIIDAWQNIKTIEQNDNRLLVKYTFPANGQPSLASYQSLILTPNEQELVKVYSAIINTLPKRGPLVQLIAPLFNEAKKRSSKTNNPVAENRSALLALAKHFGGDELNAILNASANTEAAIAFQQATPPYTIYGRRDLAQHMMLSAGLTMIADEGIAELIGLDKEINDLLGGKTISAWDLLADKAGVRFANNATRSAKSARELQILASQATKDSDILPDLGADFSYSEDQFSTEDLDQLRELVELYLEELKILRE